MSAANPIQKRAGVPALPSANLQELREAIRIAKEDRDECLRFFKPVIRGAYVVGFDLEKPKYLMERFARLDGNIHELDLLRKRELSLLGDGKEPEGFTTEDTENTESLNQGGTEA